MCSSIVRDRGSVLLVVSNLPCCVPLERVEAVMPSINRKRGWSALTLMGPSHNPSEMIAASARATVTKRLDALIAKFPR